MLLRSSIYCLLIYLKRAQKEKLWGALEEGRGSIVGNSAQGVLRRFAGIFCFSGEFLC